MKHVNALEIRNRLGSVLDELEKTGEPVILDKGRHPRAVLISIDDFERRFVDRQTEDKKKDLLRRVRMSRAMAIGGADSLTILRELRGDLP